MNTGVSFQYVLPGHHPDRILVAEEETGNFIYKSLLPFFTVIRVAHGDHVLPMALKYLPNLVIADLMTPGINGPALCRHLKNDDRTNDIPIIMITGRDDIKIKIEGFNNGADDYMAKPFHVNELQARARNLIEARKKLREKYRYQITLNSHEVSVQSMDEKLLHKVMEVVELHIDDPQFGVGTFAREVGVSTIQLYRKLLSLTGFAPNDFLRDQRLKRAASLLERKAGNVTEVAYRVGFNTLSYFCQCFRVKFGCTPKDYVRTRQLQF